MEYENELSSFKTLYLLLFSIYLPLTKTTLNVQVIFYFITISFSKAII